MEELERPREPEIPDSNLQDALEILRQWENGQIRLSPDGVAVCRFLQSAKIGELATATNAELSI